MSAPTPTPEQIRERLQNQIESVRVFGQTDTQAFVSERRAMIAVADALASVLSLLDQRDAEITQLKGWKESALETLGKWHQAGDALLKFIPDAKLGHDIPTLLRERIPEVLLRMTEERDQWNRRAEDAEGRIANATA